MSKFYFLIFLFVLIGCGSGGDSTSESEDSTKFSMSFTTLSSAESGINFTNTITETADFNLFNYEYIYNGGGVAVGDINNDGLTDIYFTGNQVSDKLYLNKGDLKFEDITEKAIGAKAKEGWRTGVVMVDINNDGWLDIYVSRSGAPVDKNLMGNLLYVNNGDNTFSEKAAEYGIDIKRNTTQSAFFDFDNDGDLDLYVMNHLHNKVNQGVSYPANLTAMQEAFDQFSDVLLENVDGKYIDVSKKAGINNFTFGLGLAIADLNDDGWEDIYVSNDYSAPDFMYINQQNGTFKDEILTRTQHISNFSMGNDIADFNNDQLPDIITLDMVSEDHIRSKRNMGGMNTKKFWESVRNGFHYQYMFNALQLNNGNGTFSEIGQLSGISKTDWSWAPLFADFDNDGLQDLFITNGYRRDARDVDATAEIKKDQKQINDFEAALELLPATKIENYMYKNSGDLKFEKVTEQWKMNQPVNSNGVAYADFDNDGDLDLVLNNMDEVSFVMRNDLQSNNNYLRIKFEGNEKNKMCLGVKVKITIGDKIQYKEFQIERGFQSSVEPIMHFGIGDAKVIDEVIAEWPGQMVVRLVDVNANQIITINQSEARVLNLTVPKKNPPLFAQTQNVLNHKHQEKFIDDFEREILLPNKMSQLGPFMSKGDVNGDGLEDLYISGSFGFSGGSLYLQNQSGNFSEKVGPWKKMLQKHEEQGSVFFDADMDKDLDLYVVSGSNEHAFNSPLMQDQLYINDGKGNFKNETETRLPKMESSGQRVSAGDIDKDGDMDLFVGGRQVPGVYPFAPRSFVLQNDGGIFKDITEKSTDLMSPGMITESIFDDFDADGDLDLICVGEWMPISFYENANGVFKNVTARYNLTESTGWWNSISAGDFNGDGKNDYVVGNVGENNKFHPSKEKPLEIYCHDFDGNGTYDIVLGKYQNGVCYPVRGRQCSSEQMPFIQQKFPTYADFAMADLKKIYGEDNLKSALHYSAYEFSSCILLSNGGTYTLQKLPVYAQLGPLNKTLVGDYNKDGNLDIIGVGNNHAAEVETIRYDGGRGVVLLGDGKGNFEQLSPSESGFFVNLDAKDMIQIGDVIFVSSNNASVLSFILK